MHLITKYSDQCKAMPFVWIFLLKDLYGDLKSSLLPLPNLVKGSRRHMSNFPHYLLSNSEWVDSTDWKAAAHLSHTTTK